MLKDTHTVHLYVSRSTHDGLMIPKFMYGHLQLMGLVLSNSSLNIYVMIYLYIWVSYSTLRVYYYGPPPPLTHPMPEHNKVGPGGYHNKKHNKSSLLWLQA